MSDVAGMNRYRHTVHVGVIAACVVKHRDSGHNEPLVTQQT